MNSKQVCLLLLALIVFSPVPSLSIAGRVGTSNEPDALPTSPAVEEEPPVSSPSTTPPDTGYSEAGAPATPAPPSNMNLTGAARGAACFWNQTQPFVNRDDQKDIIAVLGDGEFCREAINFTRIGVGGLTQSLEDDAPTFYLDWAYNQPLLLSFWIKEPVRLDGFWLCLYDKTEGETRFAVYRAQIGMSSPTYPDVISPPVVPISTRLIGPVAGRQWVWFDVDQSTTILDPAMTYNNTFYFAIWKTANSHKLYPLGLDDAKDGEDEEDVYLYWTPTYRTEDYLLNVSLAPVSPFFYPSTMGMRVNGSAVLDRSSPGTGWWDMPVDPPIRAPGTSRYYDVTLNWMGYYQWPVNFDGYWLGSYLNWTYANAKVRVWIGQSSAIWTLNTTIRFPPASRDRIIVVSIEEDWNVKEVYKSLVPSSIGVIHDDWVEYPTYLRINSAGDGYWTIRCESPNYATGAEVRDASGQIITAANATDSVTARGYERDFFGRDATNGSAYLLVFDPMGTFVFMKIGSVLMPPGGYVDINWSIPDSGTYAGIYWLQILWSNWTEVGYDHVPLAVHSQTQLHVTYENPPPGEPVLRGEYVQIEVYYNNSFGNSISGATVKLYDNDTKEEWGEYVWYDLTPYGRPGYYLTYIGTSQASPEILYNVTLTVSADYYDEQSCSRQFVVKSKKATILFFWEGNPLPGLTNTSPTDWRTSPEPYINDSALQFTIMYTDDVGRPLYGAQLAPLIFVNGTTPYKRLDWIDLGLLDSTKAGRYNITLDTNQIGTVVLHEGDICYIRILALYPGFEPTWSDFIWVRPKSRPAYIDVPEQFRNVTLYAEWHYTSALRVVLRDALKGDDLSHGNLSAFITGLGNVTLVLATPGLGLYEIRDLDTANIPIGTHNVTVYATARDFTPSTANLNLTIRVKQEIGYDIVAWDYQKLQPNLGTRCILTIRFFFKAGLASQMAMCTTSWHPMARARQTDSSLPEGTTVMLSIESTAGSMKSVYLSLDANGTVSYEYFFDVEGEYYFFVTIEKAEDYAKLEHVRLEDGGVALIASIVSSLSYLTARLPFYALIAALAIVIPLSGYLGYRQAVVLPRKRRRLAKYQSIADTFSDVANLSRLLVLHKESGICVFDPFAEETKDATLVAGFLQAISTFGHDLVETPGLAGKDKEQASTLRELTYEGFRILIHDGRFVRNALVLSGKPSDQLRERLERFTGEFEQRYRKDFDHWSGRVDQFNSASDLVEEIFLVSLRLPHRVQARRPRGVTLNPLEEDLYKLAKELTKDREYLFLGQILSTYLITAKHDKLEALMSIYQLRSKGLLVPWQLGTTMTAATEKAEKGTP